jgi:F0F1-type ATP synthase assembly protein I
MNNLEDLNKRLEEAKARQDSLNPKSPAPSGQEMAIGIRAFMEMIGVLLGSALMGYALDAVFKTGPVLLFSFIILGIFAAVFNLYKLSRNLGTAIGSNSLQKPEKDDR